MKRTFLRIGVLLGLAAGLLVSRAARAADCGCDHEIQPGTKAVNGTTLGIQPGDVVCVMAGDYEYIRFQEIHGTAQAPIVIKNCGGVVDVRNTDRAYAVDFQGSSKHFHLTGTGDAASTYGFRVSAPDVEPYPGVGLWFLDKSTNYEVDHVEVYETGFAGVMAKTDPLCDGSADQGTFIQRDVRLHHLWVHDTGGEGFYVGSTQSAGHTITCQNKSEVHQPHFLEGIEIDHVLVEDTGWDGMQVGMAHTGCLVHDNVIRRVGSAKVEYQQQGMQIGTYSKCDVRRNTLSDGLAMGIIVLGAFDTTIADNVIARFTGDSVYANINKTPGPVAYRIAHNTMLDFGGSAVRVFGDQVEGGFAWNNLVVGPSGAIAAGGDVGWDASGNLFVDKVEDARFVDAAGDDFHLANDSPARGAGIDHTGDGFDIDRDGLLRAVPPAVGAYEHADDSPTSGAGGAGPSGSGGAGGGGGVGGGNAGSTTSSTGTTTSSAGGDGAGASGGGNAGEDGGCSCRAGGSTETGSTAALAALALALLGIARRR